LKIIDFHTHFYTPERSKDDRDYLISKGLVLPGPDGELKGLQNSMRTAGIDLAVNLPAALNAKEVFEANSLMILHNKACKDVYGLGTMHADMAKDAAKEAARLVHNGIKGIKLNPQSQQFNPDDNKMAPIYDACTDAGLFILFHAGAGAETGFDPETIFARPERFEKVIKNYPKLRIILAHMGGLQMWQEAFDCVIGMDILIDTAYTTVMDDALFRDAVKKHGADKILFGSDFPWQEQEKIIGTVIRCVKDEKAKEMIFYRNAEKLLQGRI
jgi:predicted TIM-barrel fold metal-dependent hydrolase